MKTATFFENIVKASKEEDLPLEAVLERLKEEGLQKMNIAARSLEERGKPLLGLIHEKGIEIEGVYHHFDFVENTEDDSFIRYIDMASASGAENFLAIPGLYSGKYKKDECERRMVEGLRRTVNYARKKKMTVCIEDFDSADSPLCRIDKMGQFLTEIPELKVAFDTGNFACGLEDELEAYELFKDRICTVHLKDRGKVQLHIKDRPCLCLDGSEIYPCPVGRGEIHISEKIGRAHV